MNTTKGDQMWLCNGAAIKPYFLKVCSISSSMLFIDKECDLRRGSTLVSQIPTKGE